MRPPPDPAWDCMMIGDDDHIYNEYGEKRLLAPADYRMKFGKYEGLTLDDINDEWYLDFLAKIAVEKGDGFLMRCLELKRK